MANVPNTETALGALADLLEKASAGELEDEVAIILGRGTDRADLARQVATALAAGNVAVVAANEERARREAAEADRDRLRGERDQAIKHWRDVARAQSDRADLLGKRLATVRRQAIETDQRNREALARAVGLDLDTGRVLPAGGLGYLLHKLTEAAAGALAYLTPEPGREGSPDELDEVDARMAARARANLREALLLAGDERGQAHD